MLKFSGRALTETERNKLKAIAPSETDNCCIGYMKTESGRYVPVARFFKGDTLLSYFFI